jgi:hypothetical protein
MLDEIDDAPGGSAARAVMRLWFWAQWGSLPNVVAAYDPEVVERVGSEDIASTYTLNRSTYISSRPRIVDVSTGRRGTVVHVEALRRNAPPQRSSFTLRRRDGYWYVVFDTVLEQGLAAWVQFRSMPDPDAKDIPAAAVRAGINAARRYRLVGTEASNPRPALTPRVEPNS